MISLNSNKDRYCFRGNNGTHVWVMKKNIHVLIKDVVRELNTATNIDIANAINTSYELHIETFEGMSGEFTQEFYLLMQQCMNIRIKMYEENLD